jgi:serine/threonine-protein phosphatase 6 regulatory ankyrin repeat subunit B
MAGFAAEDLGGRLFDACNKGELETVIRVLEHEEAGSIVNKKYENDETPLFRAAKNGHSKIVGILLEHKADIDSINGDEGSTPLIAAAERGMKEIVELLVKHNANVNIQKHSGPERGWSALMCVSHGTEGQEKIKIAVILLDHGAMVDLEGDIDHSSLQFINKTIIECEGHQCTWTALMIACYTGREGIVQLLIERGAGINKQNDEGVSPLMFVVLNEADINDERVSPLESFAVLKKAHALLEFGARVDLRTRYGGLSALMIASRFGNTVAVELLLEYGAYVNAQSSNGWSALMFANENGHEETAQILEKYGGKVYNMQPDDDSETKKWLELVIIIACENGCTEKVIQLLKQGIDVNMTDEDDGWSLLMIVSRSGYPELAKVLLEHGADVKLKNTMGLSALMFATQNGQTETIKVLCSHGANINELYTYNNMCYSGYRSEVTGMVLNIRNHAKFINGHTETFKPLLKPGADIQLQEKPLLFLAVETGYTETVELLLKQGANIDAQDNIIGNSALFVAVKNDDTKMTKLLLDYGADINMQDNELWSPLMWASHRGYTEVTTLLLEYEAQVNLQNKFGLSALMLASQNNNIQAMQKLLENGADVNIQNNDGFSALMIASCILYDGILSELYNNYGISYQREQNLETVGLLLKHGANVNMQNNQGMSALMIAVEEEATYIISEFLVKHGAYTGLRTFNGGLSVLMIASRKGNTKVVHMLLEHGAYVNAQSSNGWSALMFANENGYENTAQILKKYGGKVYMQPDDSEMMKWLELVIACENSLTSDVDHLQKRGVNVNLIPSNQDLSALMVVSQCGNIQMTKLLLEYGANVNLKNRNGWSALIFASESRQFEIADLLLDYGADVNLQSYDGTSALMVSYLPKLSELFLDRGANINLKNNNGASAIFVAVQKGFIKLAKFLLEYGADVNEHDNEDTSTLMVAIKNENIETVKIFLDYGANINAQNKNMWSALMFSCQKGHAQMTKLLLEYGAEVNLQNRNGWTALMLMIAGTNANFEIASLLLKYGADVNIQGSDGRSALMLACQNAYFEIAKLLVEWGADVNMQNKFNGMSALMFASQHENAKTVELLLNHGADARLKDNNGFSALTFANKRIPKIVQCLTEYEALSTKYGPATLLNIEDLIAETTIEVTSCEQRFSWHEYGLQLDIPENSLPEDVHMCTICIKASITEDYQLPQNLHLVSAVYSIKCIPKVQFSKLVTLQIQHCVTQQDSLHNLCFVRSPRAGSSFQVFQSNTGSQSAAVGCFLEHSSYGFIELDRFCKFAIAGFGKRDYRANTYRHEDDARHHKIHFVILWDTNAHRKVMPICKLLVFSA